MSLNGLRTIKKLSIIIEICSLFLDVPQNDRNLVSPVEVHSSPESVGEAEQNNEDDDETIMREDK